MTKTKAQLRAEAVERLNGMYEWCDGVKSGADFMKALLWDLRIIDEEHVRDALIDLLTDDDELKVRNEASDDELFRCSYCNCKVYNIDMTEGDCGYGITFCPQCGYEIDESDSRRIEADLLTDEEQETDVSESIQNGEKDKSDTREKLKAADRVLSLLTGKERVFADDESHDEERDTREKLEEDSLQDSREGLEEDVRGYYDEHECDTLMRVDFLDAVYAWLDRQAAITERKCANEYVNTWEEGSVAWILRQYEDEKLMRDVDCDMHVLLETEELEDRISELQAKVDELEAECDARARALDFNLKHIHELQEKVDAHESELKDMDGQLRNQEHNARQSAKARAVWQERYESACEENRILRDRLRSIADDDVTVFGMRLDEVRGLKAENAELREKLDEYI